MRFSEFPISNSEYCVFFIQSYCFDKKINMQSFCMIWKFSKIWMIEKYFCSKKHQKIRKLDQKRRQNDFDSIEGHCHRKGSKHHKPKGSSQYPAPLTYFYWKEARVHKTGTRMERNILEIQWVSSLIFKIQLSYLKKWKEIVKNYELLQKFNQNLLMITWKIVGPHIKPWIPNDHYTSWIWRKIWGALR